MPEEKAISENNYGTKYGADLKKLLGLLDTIKFGSITLIIQEGKIVQIEKNEKVRLK